MSDYPNAKSDRRSKSPMPHDVWERPVHRYRRSRRNLWSLVIFLLVSIDAYSFRHFDLYEACSEPVQQFLGSPPPGSLVSAALMVYALATFLTTFTALSNEQSPKVGWKHLAYRCCFYFIFSLSGVLASHFFVVFITGICLYGSDQLHVWVYNCKSVQEQKELLGRF